MAEQEPDSMSVTYIFEDDKLVDWSISGGPHTMASALRLDAYLRATTKPLPIAI